MVPPIPENRYNMRRKNNYPSPSCKIEKYHYSFLPKAIKLWNQLDNSMKTFTEYNSFNKEMDKRKPIENTLFHLGNRKENKIIACLKLNYCNVKVHLCDLKIIDSPEGQCGHVFEDAYHYLFVCPLYNRPRATLDHTTQHSHPRQNYLDRNV